MVSASNLLIALVLQTQAPGSAPLPLSFAGAVRQATKASADTGPAAVTIAGLRSDAAGARVRQARASLLPNLSLTGSWVNRTFNPQTLGFQLPGLSLPSLVPPFNAYDGRARVTQTLFDLSSVSRVSAARGQLNAANAERSAVIETAAQNVALAYARAARANAVVAARQADSALAAELVGLAVAQQQAGVSASIDVPVVASTRLAASASMSAGTSCTPAGSLSVLPASQARASASMPKARSITSGGCPSAATRFTTRPSASSSRVRPSANS